MKDQAKIKALHLAAKACEDCSKSLHPKNELLIKEALFNIAQGLEKRARKRVKIQRDRENS